MAAEQQQSNSKAAAQPAQKQQEEEGGGDSARAVRRDDQLEALLRYRGRETKAFAQRVGDQCGMTHLAGLVAECILVADEAEVAVAEVVVDRAASRAAPHQRDAGGTQRAHPALLPQVLIATDHHGRRVAVAV
eukprot:COSAG05_NODE_5614_length_1130_cov_1.457808_1_plen_133_part_00